MLSGALVAQRFRQPAPTPRPDRRPTPRQRTNTIEELVVTAEKRAQSLQDVPIAISAFTSKKRDIVGINSDPGHDQLHAGPGNTTPRPTASSLRGVGRLTNVHAGRRVASPTTPTASTTFDRARPASRRCSPTGWRCCAGPQGTLYGRNSIGGAINMISKRPTEDWYAEVRAGYANYDHATLEVAVSGPTVVPGWKFRLAGQWDEQDRGLDQEHRPRQGQTKATSSTPSTSKARSRASSATHLDMWAKFGYTVWHNGAGGPGSQSGGWTPNIYSANPAYPNRSCRTSARPTATAATASTSSNSASRHQFNPGFGCSGLATNVISASGPGLAGCVNASHDSPWLQQQADRLPGPPAQRLHGRQPWTYHAPGFDVRYITGGVHYWYHLTGSSPNGVGQLAASTQSQRPGPPRSTRRRASTIRRRTASGATNSTSSPPTTARSSGSPAPTTSTSTTPSPSTPGGAGPDPVVQRPALRRLPERARLRQRLGRLRARHRPPLRQPAGVHDISCATYGQLTYKVNDELTLTGGLRYSHDRKYGRNRCGCSASACRPASGFRAENLRRAPRPDRRRTTVVAAGWRASASTRSRRASRDPRSTIRRDRLRARATTTLDWSAVTGTAKIDWQPDEDTLVYGSYSQRLSLRRLQHRHLHGAELPALLRQGDGRRVRGRPQEDLARVELQTNFAIYHYDYSNLQIPITTIQTAAAAHRPRPGPSFYNVPKSRSQGIELETIWHADPEPAADLQLLADRREDHDGHRRSTPSIRTRSRRAPSRSTPSPNARPVALA